MERAKLLQCCRDVIETWDAFDTKGPITEAEDPRLQVATAAHLYHNMMDRALQSAVVEETRSIVERISRIAGFATQFKIFSDRKNNDNANMGHPQH